MTSDIPCLIFSREEALVRRVRGFLADRCDVTPIAAAAALRDALQATERAIVLADLRGDEIRTLLPDVLARWPNSIVIVFGPPRSEPVLQAEALGVYAALPMEFDGPAFQTLVRHALDHLRMSAELSLLHEAAAPAPAAAVAPRAASRYALPPLREFGDLRSLLQAIADSIMATAMVLRVGIYVRAAEAAEFVLIAGRGCRGDAGAQRIPASDALVRWMEISAQMVCRSTLSNVRSVGDQLMLRRALDAFAAELIVPLQGRSRMLGWLVLGRQATGTPYEAADLQDIMQLADHAGTAVENALLYEEVTLQKSFAETLLQSIPTGIIASNQAGQVSWFNDAAEKILRLRREDLMGRPLEQAGSRIAAQVRGVLQGDGAAAAPLEWKDPATRRNLLVSTTRLTRGAECIGAVTFVHDQTQARLLRDKQRELDRSLFWTDLAANLSHQLRQPLVAIKTFAQLLPERYAESEFRNEFCPLVVQEVDRLNAIIRQINTFANVPTPRIERISLREAVTRAIELAKFRTHPDGIAIRTAFDDDLPAVQGDSKALAECFSHIVANAIEALEGRKQGSIDVAVRRAPGAAPAAEVVVRDSGPGIPTELRDKVFSPFCTNKTSGGMGLGLPMAQRTVVDHNGSIHIDTGSGGTTVTVLLPAAEPQEIALEALADRR